MDEAVAEFSAITGSSTQVAAHFLRISDGDTQQAIQLFFDSPDISAALSNNAASAPPRPTQPATSRRVNKGRMDSQGVIHVDSDDDDDDDMNDDDDDDTFDRNDSPQPQATSSNNRDPSALAASAAISASYDDDEAMARSMQEELYAGGDMTGDFNDGVRAPLARTTETLVGPGADWTSADMHDTVLEQMRARAQPRRQGMGVFSQHTPGSSSRWYDGDMSAGNEPSSRSESRKRERLAELYRPPFELMRKIPWEEARQAGKDEEKWILVNVQNYSVFDCSALNRDIWSDPGVKDTVKENFIFMQYDQDDVRGRTYIQYYFPLKDSSAAYPHIAIIDPRTGEQVKVWSGPPVPKAADFMMQLHEFLERYSLDASAKNPVAKRKVEKPMAVDVDRLTEDEMLNLAMQNSLANGETGPRELDPDDLTKSFGDISKGKGKDSEDEVVDDAPEVEAHSSFRAISSNNPQTEPTDPATTSRIQFRHANGRIIRRFDNSDPVRRIYEWLKSEPLEGKQGMDFELKSMGKDLIDSLDSTITDAGLKGSTVMIEYVEE